MPLAQSYGEAKTHVERLVARFARNLEAYKRPGDKEAQVRAGFIDLLFEALGWDVRNTKGDAGPTSLSSHPATASPTGRGWR